MKISKNLSISSVVLAMLLCLTFVSFSSEATTNIPHPNDFFGVELGADRVLVDYSQLEEYYKVVADNSDRVLMEEVGTSGYGWHSLYLLTISSPENIERIDEIKQNQSLLTDPRVLSEEGMEEIIEEEEQPMTMFINPAMHASEVASPQMLPIFVYDYVTSDDPEILEYLDSVVILMSPTHNPDGLDIESHWYWEQLGTPYEGSYPPELYCKYSGHDNNRDLFMSNLAESKAWNNVLYHEWLPILIYDIHQMGNKGARYFMPPFFDPPNPEIHNTVISDIQLFGGAAVNRLNEEKLPGVVTQAVYDMWWQGGFRLTPYYHNMVGILTEAASAKRATPVEIPFEDLGGHRRGLPTAKQRYLNFTNPWQGGTWRMGDIFPYEYETIMSFLDTSTRHRDDLIRRYYLRNQDAVEKGSSEAPYAFIFPVDEQNDLGSLEWMIDVLNIQGMEIHQTMKPIQVEGKTYPAKSIVIRTDQPQRPNVMSLLSPQQYPPRYEYPGGPPERPYDIAAWCLPMIMGVEVEEINVPLDSADLIEVKGLEQGQAAELFEGKVIGPVDTDYGFVFAADRNDSALARNRLLEAGYSVFNTDGKLAIADQVFSAGSSVIPQAEGLNSFIKELAEDIGIDVYAIDQEPDVEMREINKPRIALYTSWNANMDTGWIRFILDSFEFDYVRLRDTAVRKGDLNEQFDIIIFGDESLSRIKNGRDPESYPEQYAGGIGDEGIVALEQFANNGGTLLLIDDASELAIEEFGVPVRNVLADVEMEDFWCPGSILNIEMDNSHPVAQGYPAETYAFFKSSPTFEVTGDGPVVFAKWPEDPDEIKAAGWLEGPEVIAGKAALVEAPIGEGKAILTGFMTNHRAQNHENFKIIFNSIFQSVL